MLMRDIFTVMKFTINDMIKRKSFIISTLIILILIVIGFNVPNLIKSFNGDNSGDKLLIIDSKNVFEGTLENLKQMDLGYEFEVTNEDLKKIINEIPIDIKISDEELNELTNEINTAIKENIEYKEEINLDEKVISIIKFIQSKYMYIFIMCFIIINYLLISLLTWSFYKPLRYLSIPTMLTGITLIVTIFLPSLLINILNQLLKYY